MILRKIPGFESKERPREQLLVERNEAETIALGYVSIHTGESTQVGFHEDEEEIYVILKGKARLQIGDEIREAGAGEVAYVPRNTKHQMTCISEEKLEYLYFANWPEQVDAREARS